MSYILDALRRADAERQQGQVPGLHAAPAAGRLQAQPPAWRPVAWLLVGALLLAAGALALLLWWRAAPALAPAVATAAMAPSAGSSAVPMAPAATGPAPVPSTAPAALPIVVSAAPVLPAPAAGPAAATAPAGPPMPAAAETSAAPTVPLASLPPEQRRQLPALVPGGSVWSDSAASRFVILDGQVLREGDAAAPGLLLERIERKAAVLRWKGQRLEVPL